MSIFKNYRNRRSIKESLQQLKIGTQSYEMLGNCRDAIFFGPNYEHGTSLMLLPYPKFNEAGKAIGIQPDRIPDEPEEFTEWVFFAPGVLRLGVNPVTMLFDEPEVGGYNPSIHNPVNLLRKACYNARSTVIRTPYGDSETERWADLTQTKTRPDGSLEFAKIPKVQNIYIMPVVVYKHGDQDFLNTLGRGYGEDSSDPTPYLVVNQNTMAYALYPALNELDENEELKHETFTGCRYVHFYDRQKGSCEAMRNELMSKQKKRFGTVQQGGDLKGFAVYVSQTLYGTMHDPKPDRRKYEELAKLKVQPWEKVLKAYTPEEAAEVIAEKAGLPLALLYYAWKDMPNYLSQTLKNRLKEAVISTPAKTPPAPVPEHEQEETLEEELPQLPAETENQILEELSHSISEHLSSGIEEEDKNGQEEKQPVPPSRSSESRNPRPKMGKIISSEDIPF